MRRFFVMLGIFSLVVLGAMPASAKGEELHAKVVVVGAGLPGGIVTLGADGGSFVFGSSLWESKWDVPNMGGSLEPEAHLGPRYVVRVVLNCDHGDRSRYRQFLYPNGPEGPQLYTPVGVEACGALTEPGYDPLGATLESLLHSHGVEFHPAPTPPATTETPETDVRGSDVSVTVIGAPIALALLVGGEIVRRRRRR